MNEEVDYEEDIDPAPAAAAVEERRSRGGGGTSDEIKRKGRGHNQQHNEDHSFQSSSRVFENIQRGKGAGPLQSIEGWIVFVTNVHPEAQEDDILDKFSEFGTVKNIHVNLDRRTGFVKGYALVEFEEYDDALSAIKGLDGQPLLDQVIQVDWAFVKK